MSKLRELPDSRRNFIGKVATGLAGTLAAPGAVLGANDRIRAGIIGSGDRGIHLARELMECSNTEVAAFSDIYRKRLDEAALVVPTARRVTDYRELLDDASLDAIVIATPQHLHGEPFLAALDAGKHVYVENAMAFTVEEAKQMRQAAQNSPKRAVQVGHQWCSAGMAADARHFLAGGKVGRITAIRASMYRNTPHGKPQWARLVYPDMTPDNIAWQDFLGGAPDRQFDAGRYLNWRLFFDYSGGNVHENLSHQLAFWYKTLNLEIPAAVTMTGGVYLWKDGREVPDTMSVAMEHSEELLFKWDSGFGNAHPGTTEEVLGTDGTIVRGQQIRYLPQKVNQPNGKELIGQTPTPRNAHMANFLDAIRTGRATNCPVELGYRVSIACRMAIESYLQARTVRWDPVQEEIV